MKLTVVIPTFKRDKYVLPLIKQLLDQNFDDFEILFVTQSKVEIPELKNLVTTNSKIKYIEQFEKVGAVYNRNLGIRNASGEVTLFLDDDIVIKNEKFLSNHYRNYQESEIGGVLGRITQDDFPEPDENIAPGFISKTGRFYVNFNSRKRQYVMGGGTGNLSVRTEILKDLNGFDENYLRGLREDSDLCLRVLRTHKFVFDPDAEVHHLNAGSGGMETRKKQDLNDRLQWYHRFFHNEILIFLKHLNWIYLPIFIFYHRLRPILACSFYYGKGNLNAVFMPWKAMFAGYKTYRKEVAEKSAWL